MRRRTDNMRLRPGGAERRSWISWLLVVAVLLNATWVPFHLATEHHLGHGPFGDGFAVVVAHASHEHEHDETANGGHDDPGTPHEPHSALEHKVLLVGGATGTPVLKFWKIDFVATAAVLL